MLPSWSTESIGRTHISRIGHTHRLVDRAHLDGGAEDELLVLDLVQLSLAPRESERRRQITHLVLEVLDTTWVQRAGSETKVGKLDVTSPIDEEVLRLKIAVNVAESVEGIDGAEHFGAVEASVLFL